MTNEEKLQNFRDITMEEARRKSNEELSSYEQSLENLFEEYTKMKEEQADMLMKSERESMHKELNKQLSLEQIRIRHEYTKCYEELKGRLFCEVREMLEEYRKTADYERLLVKQIRKAVKFARGEEMTVYMDPADAARKESLEAAGGAPLTVSEYSFGGGIRAVLPNRSVLIDNSFDTKMKEVMDNFSFKGGSSNEK